MEWLLIAQDALRSASDNPWFWISGQAGVTGILAWYLWYTQKYALPSIMDRHSKTVRDIVKDFQAEREADRLAVQNTAREFREEITRLHEDMKQERKFDREARHSEIELITKSFVGACDRMGIQPWRLAEAPEDDEKQ